jgi:hypothetical protein
MVITVRKFTHRHCDDLQPGCCSLRRHFYRASGKGILPTSFLLFTLLYSCIARHDCYHFLYARPRMLYDTKPTPPLTISCTETHARRAAASRRGPLIIESILSA